MKANSALFQIQVRTCCRAICKRLATNIDSDRWSSAELSALLIDVILWSLASFTILHPPSKQHDFPIISYIYIYNFHYVLPGVPPQTQNPDQQNHPKRKRSWISITFNRCLSFAVQKKGTTMVQDHMCCAKISWMLICPMLWMRPPRGHWPSGLPPEPRAVQHLTALTAKKAKPREMTEVRAYGQTTGLGRELDMACNQKMSLGDELPQNGSPWSWLLEAGVISIPESMTQLSETWAIGELAASKARASKPEPPWNSPIAVPGIRLSDMLTSIKNNYGETLVKCQLRYDSTKSYQNSNAMTG